MSLSLICRLSARRWEIQKRIPSPAHNELVMYWSRQSCPQSAVTQTKCSQHRTRSADQVRWDGDSDHRNCQNYLLLMPAIICPLSLTLTTILQGWYFCLYLADESSESQKDWHPQKDILGPKLVLRYATWIHGGSRAWVYLKEWARFP